jgi:hypothetical protein
MKYKVTSKIVKLEQTLGGVTIRHNQDYQRTIEWLKDDEANEFLSLEEASQLKKFLDSKNNFSNNEIVEVRINDREPSIAELMIFTKDVEEKRISIDEPILISQCKDLKDYNLGFEIEGFLNTNKLV